MMEDRDIRLMRIACELAADVVSDESKTEIGSLDAQDTEELFHYLAQTGFTLRAWAAFKKIKKELPGSLQDAVNHNTIYAMIQKKRLADQLAEMQREFDRHLVRYVCMKGAVFNHYIPENDYYNLGDIDVLVHPDDAERAYGLLLRLGFSGDSDDPDKVDFQKTMFQHYPELHRKNSLTVEVHNKLTNFSEHVRFDYGGMLDRARELRSGTSTVRAPSPDDHLLMLSHHMYRHQYWEAEFKVKTNLCVLYMLRNFKDGLDWERILSEAEKAGFLFGLAYALYNATTFINAGEFEQLIPKKVRDMLYNGEFMREKDALHMWISFSDKPLTYWDSKKFPYLRRLFTGNLFTLKVQDLDKDNIQEFIRTHLIMSYLCGGYEKKCEELNLRFKREYRFGSIRPEQAKEE